MRPVRPLRSYRAASGLRGARRGRLSGSGDELGDTLLGLNPPLVAPPGRVLEGFFLMPDEPSSVSMQRQTRTASELTGFRVATTPDGAIQGPHGARNTKASQFQLLPRQLLCESPHSS